MSSGGRKRSRAGACKNCRVRKKRCIPTDDQLSCQFCMSLSTTCSLDQSYGARRVVKGDNLIPGSGSYSQTSAPRGPLHGPFGPPSAIQGVTSSASQSPNSLTLELATLYFRYIHNAAHTLFHEPSFIHQLNEGKAPELLVQAICALAARFSQSRAFENIDPLDRGKRFAGEAQNLMRNHMLSPSLQTIQACILIGNYMGGEGDMNSKHIYMGMARLHSEILRIWEIPTGSSVVEREERRRTWLAVRIADKWSAADMSLDPALYQNSLLLLPLVGDYEFLTCNAGELHEDDSLVASEHNMWAQMARTLDIYTQINALLRRLSRNAISFQSYCGEVPVLAQHLDHWAERLPASLVYDEANYSQFARKGLGSTFLSMHIGYYHFRQILYFPFLDARAERHSEPSSPDYRNIASNATMCKQSASAVSDIVQVASKVAGCELYYFLSGHITVVSSCVHLHTLLFSEDAKEVQIARDLLISNFEYLMELKRHWAVLDRSLSRLRTFQNDCRTSLSDPFALDNWMVRFLMEHTSSISERPHGIASDFDTKSPFGPPTSPNAMNLESQGDTIDPANLALPVDVTQPVFEDTSSTNWVTLSRLLSDQDLSSEILVDSALDWLLD